MHQYLSNSRSNKLFHRFKCYSWDNNHFISSFSLLQSSFICWWKCQEQVRQCNSVFNIHAPPKEDNIWLIIIIIIHRLKDFMLGLHRVVVQNVGWNGLFRVVPVAVAWLVVLVRMDPETTDPLSSVCPFVRLIDRYRYQYKLGLMLG